MLKKFEVGKEYKCVALYGGYYGIKVVGRCKEKRRPEKGLFETSLQKGL